MAASHQSVGSGAVERRTEKAAVQEISPISLIIRCFAERKGDQWQAFTLEFGLAAQADTWPEVKAKLESMLISYLHDALVGEDREHAYDLLTRRAPWQMYARFYLYQALHRLSGTVKSKDRTVYREPVALEPRLCTM
jgi:hypothetical protein